MIAAGSSPDTAAEGIYHAPVFGQNLGANDNMKSSLLPGFEEVVRRTLPENA